MRPTHFCIGQYKGSKLVSIVSGCGRNKGTLGVEHSKRTAAKYARELNKRNDGFTYKAEELN